jgi:flagella basal body P-ring formation protein FlgA
MLHLSLENSDAPDVRPRRAPSVPPTVRVGAALQADWVTPSLHAQLPVVAIESGGAGDEIRVRVKDTNRIMHARILSAHTVSILSAGV